MWGVVRQQLLVDDAIPYTSHNSSACLVIEASRNGSLLNELTARAATHLERHAAAGSDPGVCVAARGRPGIGRPDGVRPGMYAQRGDPGRRSAGVSGNSFIRAWGLKRRDHRRCGRRRVDRCRLVRPIHRVRPAAPTAFRAARGRIGSARHPGHVHGPGCLRAKARRSRVDQKLGAAAPDGRPAGSDRRPTGARASGKPWAAAGAGKKAVIRPPISDDGTPPATQRFAVLR